LPKRSNPKIDEKTRWSEHETLPGTNPGFKHTQTCGKEDVRRNCGPDRVQGEGRRDSSPGGERKHGGTKAMMEVTKYFLVKENATAATGKSCSKRGLNEARG